MGNILERLYEYIEHKGVRPTTFEKEVGLSNGYLHTTKKRGSVMGVEIAMKIVDNCRDLNPEWFLKGKGDMLLKEEEEPSNNASLSNKERDLLEKIIASQQETILILSKKVAGDTVAAV